jgi:hypothetical protein
MDASRMRTYILECTRDFFTRWPDEPCSGAARFESASSGAAPLRSATSTAALRSLDRLGADPLASATVGVDPWPPPAMRET